MWDNHCGLSCDILAWTSNMYRSCLGEYTWPCQIQIDCDMGLVGWCAPTSNICHWWTLTSLSRGHKLFFSQWVLFIIAMMPMHNMLLQQSCQRCIKERYFCIINSWPSEGLPSFYRKLKKEGPRLDIWQCEVLSMMRLNRGILLK